MEGRDEIDVAPDGSAKVQRAIAEDTMRQRLALFELSSKQADEKKIDRIEDRLASIETVLENLAAKLANLDIRKDSQDQNGQSGPSRVGRSPNCISEDTTDSPAPFEGETTLNTQSEYARHLLERAVINTPSIGQNSEIKAALTSLQSMVNRQNIPTDKDEARFFKNLAPETALSKLERPPWDAVNEVLDKATTAPTMCFAVVFPFLKMRNIKEHFEEAFDEEDCPPGRRVFIYGVLYNLFTEFSSYPLLGPRVVNYRKYALQCRTQLETAMSQLDLFLPANYENILGLLLASSYAVELCKPSLCWILTATAAGMCQSLGYHRISSMKDDSEDERAAKIHAFWFTYIMDKTLSLRLGRASSIQDWDMSLPYPVTTQGCNPIAPNILLYWIKVAQIQGQTYERLFSPAAFLKSDEERAQVASELTNALNHAWGERGDASELDISWIGADLVAWPPKQSLPDHPTDPSSKHLQSDLYNFSTNAQPHPERNSPSSNLPGSFGGVGDLFYHADIVMHYSLMSLIQRAVSPDPFSFNQDCIESARAALVAHQRCSKKFNVKGNEELWSGYVHWSVLQAPFTPFIVVFCNAISQCDPSDLSFLSEFVSSLESCRTVSEGTDKLYKMCHTFFQVAKLYVEAKTKDAQQQAQQEGQYFVTADGEQNLDLSAMTQFDPFLSALGLVPNSAWPMATFPPATSGQDASAGFQGAKGGFDSLPMGNVNTVQDWFSGSRYIMGLMEEDINMLDENL
ncbi:hypothetical protein K469DRAFT_730100 [Zopfia rhizophila CBS 207.26]|uniref:Xylanolytic transcriptional activator regulatory domain-containing protein n=1 Tax=Zopfia rhizophila CBS 207.26 TaxID=1314779 RepID=A0A6A6EQB6_9PEZI|nr:hypothetical protein K469DRAFT_730100 [Zopfia rhizophila CBS 207.26]